MDSSGHLVVRAGGRCCALPLPSVRRVLRGLTLYPVPSADRRLLGLAQFGGEPLAVVDLAAVLGEAPGEGGLTVVLARPGRRRGGFGLAVDAVVGVDHLGDLRTPDAWTGAGNGVVAGEADGAGEPVLVLDPEAVQGVVPRSGDDNGREPE